MKFYKFQGTGNDFVMIENLDKKIKLSSSDVLKICDRKFGIGADGVILVEKGTEGGDLFMNYWNSDGSLAEMCGNGTRCTAHFAKEILGFKNDYLNLETRSGIKKIEIKKDNLFTVNMGAPDFKKFADFPKQSKKFEGTEFQFVSMGNPHAIGFFDSEKSATKFLNNIAPAMEIDIDNFPNKVNISVLWKIGENYFGSKTHERGCGQTLACGTAMSGCFAWIEKLNKGGSKIQIDVPGGELHFEFNDLGEILMTGPSKKVFEGDFDLADL